MTFPSISKNAGRLLGLFLVTALGALAFGAQAQPAAAGVPGGCPSAATGDPTWLAQPADLPGDAVVVASERNPDGSFTVEYRPADGGTAVAPGEELGRIVPADEPSGCDPFSPIPCGQCVYSPHYTTTCGSCGTCYFTSCGTGQACETKRTDCWLCNPPSWGWCNSPVSLGWDCLGTYCCS